MLAAWRAAVKHLHPPLVHFPIALLVFSVAADWVGYFTRIDSLGNAGWWALLGAALSGLAAVGAGLFDMRRAHLAGSLSEEVHHCVHRHMRVGLILLAGILALAFWRWTLFDGNRAMLMLYLDAAVLTVALAALQGWLGGKLVYSDGVSVKMQGTNKTAIKPVKADHGYHH